LYTIKYYTNYFRSYKFFRLRLLATPPDKIEDFIKDQRTEVKAFTRSIIDLIVLGESSLTYSEAWNLSGEEREMFYESIKERNEAKSGNKKSTQQTL